MVPDECLLCYPTRNVSQVDGYLFRSVTQFGQTNVLSFARIHVVSARIGGSTAPSPDPPPVPYAYDDIMHVFVHKRYLTETDVKVHGQNI